ncbi:MAG: hypothetical protein NXH70_08275 [Hyphomonas sp.]|nr:hypothetical protein [Hyphomonas sp.]
MEKGNMKAHPLLFATAGISVLLVGSANTEYLSAERLGFVQLPEEFSTKQVQLEPPVVGLLPPKVGVEPQYEAKSIAEYDLVAQRWMAWLTGVIAILTAIIASLTLWGVNILKLTLRDTKLVLAEARLATKAAEDSVSTTREIGQAQVRCYPAFERATITIDTGLILNLRTKNYGSSPAIMIYARNVAARITNLDTDQVYWLADTPDTQWYPIGTLSSGAVQNTTHGIGMHNTMAATLGDGVPGLLDIDVRGTFYWRDVFGVDHSKPFLVSATSGEYHLPLDANVNCDVTQAYADALWDQACAQLDLES